MMTFSRKATGALFARVTRSSVWGRGAPSSTTVARAAGGGGALGGSVSGAMTRHRGRHNRSRYMDASSGPWRGTAHAADPERPRVILISLSGRRRLDNGKRGKRGKRRERRGRVVRSGGGAKGRRGGRAC